MISESICVNRFCRGVLRQKSQNDASPQVERTFFVVFQISTATPPSYDTNVMLFRVQQKNATYFSNLSVPAKVQQRTAAKHANSLSLKAKQQNVCCNVGRYKVIVPKCVAARRGAPRHSALCRCALPSRHDAAQRDYVLGLWDSARRVALSYWGTSSSKHATTVNNKK